MIFHLALMGMLGQSLIAPDNGAHEYLTEWGKQVERTAPGLMANGTLRADSEGNQPHAFEAADVLREERNARLLAQHANVSDATLHKPYLATARRNAERADSPLHDMRDAIREDSATAGGSVLARQLEAQWARVVETKRPELTGLTYFPLNTDAGPGSENIRIIRFAVRGKAVVFNGGQTPVPATSIRQVAKHVYFRYLVAGATWSVFDQMSWDMAKLNGISRSLETAARAIEELHDQIIWLGSPANGLYGVLNYPYLATRIVQTAFSATANVDTMIAEIVSMYTYPLEKSNGAFRSNRLMFGTKLYNFLAGRPRATGTDKSVMEYLREKIQVIADGYGIGKVEFMATYRLNDLGSTSLSSPSGVHGVLVTDNDPDTISVVVSQPTTMLPLEQQGFNFQQICYKAVAGVTMNNPGATLLGKVTLS